ncbi:MAG TPA: hypothetical protein VGO93_02040 [Candidatus Xenobia bacterium]
MGYLVTKVVLQPHDGGVEIETELLGRNLSLEDAQKAAHRLAKKHDMTVRGIRQERRETHWLEFVSTAALVALVLLG